MYREEGNVSRSGECVAERYVVVRRVCCGRVSVSRSGECMRSGECVADRGVCIGTWNVSRIGECVTERCTAGVCEHDLTRLDQARPPENTRGLVGTGPREKRLVRGKISRNEKPFM